MENKVSHIDYFFDAKLSQFEGNADETSMEAIFKHLDHTEHPIDFALNKALSDLAAAPTSLSVSDHLGSELPIIDLALYQQLRAYEAIPDKPFQFESNKRKRSFVWLFFLLLVTGVFGAFYWQNSDEISKHELISDNKNRQKNADNQPSLKLDNRNKVDVNRSKNVQSNNENNSPIFSKHREKKTTIEPTQVTEDVASKKHLGIKNLLPFDYLFEIVEIAYAPLKTKSYGPTYMAMPISFTLQTGAIKDISQSNTLLNNNQHKDAETLFEESTGKYRTGQNYSLLIDYNIGQKLNINTGLSFSMSNSTNDLDYYYTDIPVYDTTGALRGYLKRPPSSTNHTAAIIKSNSQSMSIPFNLQYNVYQFKTLGIWFGAGLQIAIQRQVKGQYFDFKSEQLIANNQKFSKGILPQMSVGFRYPLTDQWHLTTQFQMARQALTFNIQESRFRRVELLPSLNFGLIFIPHRRIK